LYIKSPCDNQNLKPGTICQFKVFVYSKLNNFFKQKISNDYQCDFIVNLLTE